MSAEPQLQEAPIPATAAPARVYLENPQELSPQPGWRGLVEIDGPWVHVYDPEAAPFARELGWESLSAWRITTTYRHVESIEWAEQWRPR